MNADHPRHVVAKVNVDQILDLRVRVLRRGTPVAHAHYAEDDDPATVHLAVLDDGAVVATSSWIPRPFPHDAAASAVQLKGMAVDDSLQRTGVGRMLLNAGLEHASSLGAELVWARARDSALPFYDTCGFDTVGDAFMDEITGMSHHLVVIRTPR